MSVVGSIELPYAFTMLLGRNPYGNPVSKGDRAGNFGFPVCTFEINATELTLIITGLLPQPYRGRAWARGGGIDVYFYHSRPKRRELRKIVNDCINIKAPIPITPRIIPDPAATMHEGGVDLVLSASGGIAEVIVSTESELQSRDTPPINLIAEARELRCFLELEAPNAGNRIHFGGRFWKPFYTQSYLTSVRPHTPFLNYGITIHIPFDEEYSHFINGMLTATT